MSEGGSLWAGLWSAVALGLWVACPAAAEGVPDAGASDPFEEYLAAPFALADGFAPPVGAPWKRARAFREGASEQWRAGRSSSAVASVASGRVALVESGSVVLEHLFQENHQRRSAHSVYSGLERTAVAAGDLVARGQEIGGVAPGGLLTFGLEEEGAAVDPAKFLKERQALPVPQREERLVLIHHESRRLRLYASGVRVSELEVGFGQEPGPKERRGDLRTPKGIYFVVERHKGTFDGPYGDYYGGHWIKVNYPNRWDADRGVREGFITVAQRDRIVADWAARALTDQKTKLGGGIGLHGWAGAWDGSDGGYSLSWGCVVLHNPDIERVYSQIPEGTMVVLF